MYIELAIASCLGICLSWMKFKDFFHPHFVLTSALFVMFFSDFLVRGYDDKNLSDIANEQIYFYQLIILSSLSVIYSVTYFLCKRKKGQLQLGLANSIRDSFRDRRVKRISKFLFWIAWIIFSLEIFKRLYFVNWSLNEFIIVSFGSRFDRPWASSAGMFGDGKFLLSLIGIIFPLAGLIFASIFLLFNKSKKYLSACGYILVLLLLIGSGSRTPVVFLLAYPLFLYLKISKSTLNQLIAILVTFTLLALSTSSIYNFRDTGFTANYNSATNNQPVVIYHQDDSYYRAIRAIDIASNSDERWDFLPFLGSSLLNFIPRHFWPEKPVLDESYWGSFKLPYVTITFIGELVALFGVGYGWLFSIFVGLAAFLLLYKLYTNISNPYDFLLYILGAIYAYMVFRSLLNISQFIYTLLFFYAVLRLLSSRGFFKKS